MSSSGFCVIGSTFLSLRSLLLEFPSYRQPISIYPSLFTNPPLLHYPQPIPLHSLTVLAVYCIAVSSPSPFYCLYDIFTIIFLLCFPSPLSFTNRGKSAVRSLMYQSSLLSFLYSLHLALLVSYTLSSACLPSLAVFYSFRVTCSLTQRHPFSVLSTSDFFVFMWKFWNCNFYLEAWCS